MLLYQDPLVSIFFGDEYERFIPADYQKIDSDKLLNYSPFALIQKKIDIQAAVFLHQVHGSNGIALQSKNQLSQIKTFSHDGDFLVTNLTQLGLGIATADCLPIVLYDSFNHVVSIVHAGWRGSVAGIACNALDAMKELYGSQADAIQVFFGPSAKECCYEVKVDLIRILESFDYHNDVLAQKDNKFFLNVPLFNQLILQKKGVKKEAFNVTYNLCTMCNASFCSYRRQQPTEYRQMTVVSLNAR